MDNLSDGVDVLVVGDDSESVRLIEEAFADVPSRVRVTAVTDGAEAIAVCHGRGSNGEPRPDLVLLDLDAQYEPDTSVLEALKTDPVLRPLPTLAITESTASEEISRLYELGANACIREPATAGDVARFVRVLSTFWLETAHLPDLDTYDRDDPSESFADGS